MTEAGKSGYGAAITEKSWVSVGLLIILIGFAFWMGVQHSQLRELNDFCRSIVADHESRIRILEKGK